MRRALFLGMLMLMACTETRGSHWMAEPLPPVSYPAMPGPAADDERVRAPRPTELGDPRPDAVPVPGSSGSVGSPERAAEGRSLGTFRNTYYDFPSEAAFDGPGVGLMSATCSAIATVPRAFHDAVCVQGSGRLKNGTTVSFARRDCACAEVCPRTGQKICFEALSAEKFPFGRGSLGQAITPLVTVAVDASVVPLGTALYIAAFDGVIADQGAPALDGCFLAEDRGIRVVGEHVDLFTGDPRITKRLNELVPSNRGVEVTIDAPRCQRLRR